MRLQVIGGFLLWPLVKAAGGSSEGACNDPDSFLGVGNSQCIRDNMTLATVFVLFIITISLLLEYTIKRIREAVKCPQMRIIVNRIFEEIMILGFISMLLFALDTTNAISNLSTQLDDLEERHFKEFFHYVVFLSMIYYIIIMLILLAIGKYVPRWLWHGLPQNIETDRYIPRLVSGVFQTYSITYKRLREKYENQPWTFHCNLYGQWQLWRSLEVLAYHLCRDRSRPIFTNAQEMQRIFNLSEKQSKNVTYEAYNKLCMRNMLANLTSLHWSAFFVLIAVVLVTSWFPQYDEYLFISIEVLLLLLSLIVMIKTSRILKGIVKDRLNILTQREIDNFVILRNTAFKSQPRITFKALAISVRAIIRMQMSALSHQALHCHDNRFWFRSPWFLLRLFQFSAIGQAFYLVWFSLVQSVTIFDGRLGTLKLIFIMFMPLVSLFIIMPLTMPSLVLVLSLTGFFVEQGKPVSGSRNSTDPTRDHIRRVRRSYLQNSRAELETPTPTGRRQSFSSGLRTSRRSGRSSPGSDVFLRQYDFPSPTDSLEDLEDGSVLNYTEYSDHYPSPNVENEG